MFLRTYTKKVILDLPPLNPKIMLLTKAQVSDGNVVRTAAQFKEVDVSANLAQFSSSDFSISCLEAVGALSKLTTTYAAKMHDMQYADNLDNLSISMPNENK